MADRKTLHTLEVVLVTREDAGQYSAYISNTVGAAYSSAQLLVRGRCWGLGIHTWAVQVQVVKPAPGKRRNTRRLQRKRSGITFRVRV